MQQQLLQKKGLSFVLQALLLVFLLPHQADRTDHTMHVWFESGSHCLFSCHGAILLLGALWATALCSGQASACHRCLPGLLWVPHHS